MAYRRNRGLNRDRDFLDGSIAALFLYNRQLTAKEVETLAQYHSCRFNLATESEYRVCAYVSHTASRVLLRCQKLGASSTAPYRYPGHWTPCIKAFPLCVMGQ